MNSLRAASIFGSAATSRGGQFLQQYARSHVVGCVVPLCESAVHAGKQLARLARAMLISPQMGEAHRGA